MKEFPEPPQELEGQEPSASGDYLKPVTRATLPQEIVAAIADLIMARVWKPGDRQPGSTSDVQQFERRSRASSFSALSRPAPETDLTFAGELPICCPVHFNGA